MATPLASLLTPEQISALRELAPKRDLPAPGMDPLEKVIQPIVEGQIRGFIKEHPSILDGVDWYKRRPNKAVTLTNSLAKRIVRDLLCPTTRARLVTALLEGSTGELSSDVAGIRLGASPPALEHVAETGGCATLARRAFRDWLAAKVAVKSP
jgi:hypothetical protein